MRAMLDSVVQDGNLEAELFKQKLAGHCGSQQKCSLVTFATD